MTPPRTHRTQGFQALTIVRTAVVGSVLPMGRLLVSPVQSRLLPETSLAFTHGGVVPWPAIHS